jgi:hypothetical protein
MDAIKGFFQKYGATRVGPGDSHRDAVRGMSDAALAQWREQWETMLATKRTPDGQPLPSSNYSVIERQLADVKAEQEARRR